MFVACRIWCLADACGIWCFCSDEGLTLETSAKHHIAQATNIPYQPLLIKLIFSVLAHAEKQGFFKTSHKEVLCLHIFYCKVSSNIST